MTFFMYFTKRYIPQLYGGVGQGTVHVKNIQETMFEYTVGIRADPRPIGTSYGGAGLKITARRDSRRVSLLEHLDDNFQVSTQDLPDKVRSAVLEKLTSIVNQSGWQPDSRPITRSDGHLHLIELTANEYNGLRQLCKRR